MPVIISQPNKITHSLKVSLQSVVKDLSSDHTAKSALDSWLNKNKKWDLWVAEFNDRVVGYALIKDNTLKAIAVHPATRDRGVGTRMMSKLADKSAKLSLSHDESNSWVIDCYQKLTS